ncbi:hypothetical protein RHGRI_032472 [Rhododendron griersonianum]|uniref:Uncharacterized protein n=1 Tax=Rhododendron griersonianum TaxID=479676 RepID=A0AAV6ICN0_9ERIC|nr:hypothetical protein RHGRI_032472 [Rhododendron griersonianum]
MGIVEAKVRPEYLGSTCSHCFPGHWSFVHNSGTSSVARIICSWLGSFSFSVGCYFFLSSNHLYEGHIWGFEFYFSGCGLWFESCFW